MFDDPFHIASVSNAGSTMTSPWSSNSPHGGSGDTTPKGQIRDEVQLGGHLADKVWEIFSPGGAAPASPSARGQSGSVSRARSAPGSPELLRQGSRSRSRSTIPEFHSGGSTPEPPPRHGSLSSGRPVSLIPEEEGPLVAVQAAEKSPRRANPLMDTASVTVAASPGAVADALGVATASMDAAPTAESIGVDDAIPFAVGERVTVSGYTGQGTVRFVGRHHERQSMCVLVQLDCHEGLNNGTVNGHKYCDELPERSGVLVIPSKVLRAVFESTVGILVKQLPGTGTGIVPSGNSPIPARSSVTVADCTQYDGLATSDGFSSGESSQPVIGGVLMLETGAIANSLPRESSTDSPSTVFAAKTPLSGESVPPNPLAQAQGLVPDEMVASGQALATALHKALDLKKEVPPMSSEVTLPLDVAWLALPHHASAVYI